MAEEIAHMLQSIGPVSVTRFFGGAGLSLDGTQFGFVIKGALYLRVNDVTRDKYEALGCRPFSYATRTKHVTVSSYYEAPADAVDDPSELCDWAAEAHLAATKANEHKRPPSQARAKGFAKKKVS